MLAQCFGAVGVGAVCRLLPSLGCGHRLSIACLLNHGLSFCRANRQTARTFTAEALAVDSPSNWRPCYRAVLVDAAGTFLVPSEPVSAVYLRYARPYGCHLNDEEVLARFRRAYNMPWPHSPLRYVDDARPFWRRIVEHSTGCDVPEVSEAIYQYYARAEAWHVVPGAVEALQRLKSAGVLLAVVSNFDTRLRPLLRDLKVDYLFNAVIVSAEVRAEKPNPVIFDAAVVHVGDDRRNDCWGARDAGITAWLWGYDVRSWAEVADRVLLGSQVRKGAGWICGVCARGGSLGGELQ
ncbi:hypothetical protein VOLCADRAFT_84971 [Volvox carteri f. nagariensis]|uniref:Haloacid dehalogenase-like hydrolase domain-containing protein 3 n=1 Tax=Volvox carteri f. nagariensis TaxID=3068 RepID=D8ULV0_VOLCA|nr:uncharacterized protein VOLCADRAFT_84971 [Volvox carteri f. nagariensis]EFJ39299.1 hypothetical protein VOLCADRAFT_84971 [Volvox carteri f. nagariensis]|eukprot:XP_002959636.1 hypothetical protein VOLCADRAFT_84971 [Volvox carteri f. nagariensis]